MWTVSLCSLGKLKQTKMQSGLNYVTLALTYFVHFLNTLLITRRGKMCRQLRMKKTTFRPMLISCRLLEPTSGLISQVNFSVTFQVDNFHSVHSFFYSSHFSPTAKVNFDDLYLLLSSPFSNSAFHQRAFQFGFTLFY